MQQTELIHLLTGGNLGDRMANLETARRLISERIGQVIQASHFYQTAAWGVEGQPDYLNQALAVETGLSPADVLAEIHAIELDMGRERRTRWEARTIDIDILFFGDKILETSDLSIPHPRLHQRSFALIPMLEVAPEKVHPALGKSIEELYLECEDELEVLLIDAAELTSEPMSHETVKP